MDNQELLFAFWIVALLCLIVIAAGVHVIANQYSGMESRDKPHEVRFAAENSAAGLSNFAGDGQYERPIFYDIGDAAAINQHLQSAKNEGFDARRDKGKLAPAYLSGV